MATQRYKAASAASLAIVAAALLGLDISSAGSESRYGIGRQASQAEIAAWNIDIDRDGHNLPPGRGSVAEGRSLFADQCASCHGVKGEGGIGDRLVGGQGTLKADNPVKTVGSFWPYATTLFDYIRRAMPMNSPQSLTADQVYALSAYILSLNGIVPDEAVMDAASLAAVRMPNRDGFVDDPRPDVKACSGPCR